MRSVYIISGGITKFAKAHPEKDFRLMVKESFDYAMKDVPDLTTEMIDGSVGSYFSDHFTRQLRQGQWFRTIWVSARSRPRGLRVEVPQVVSVFRQDGRQLHQEGWRSAYALVLRQ